MPGISAWTYALVTLYLTLIVICSVRGWFLQFPMFALYTGLALLVCIGALVIGNRLTTGMQIASLGVIAFQMIAAIEAYFILTDLMPTAERRSLLIASLVLGFAAGAYCAYYMPIDSAHIWYRKARRGAHIGIAVFCLIVGAYLLHKHEHLDIPKIAGWHAALLGAYSINFAATSFSVLNFRPLDLAWVSVNQIYLSGACVLLALWSLLFLRPVRIASF